MYSDLIMAHSVVHERVQWASIPPQKAELQNSFFRAEAEDIVCVTVQSQSGRKEFNYNKWKKWDGRVIMLATERFLLWMKERHTGMKAKIDGMSWWKWRQEKCTVTEQVCVS